MLESSYMSIINHLMVYTERYSLVYLGRPNEVFAFCIARPMDIKWWHRFIKWMSIERYFANLLQETGNK